MIQSIIKQLKDHDLITKPILLLIEKEQLNT